MILCLFSFEWLSDCEKRGIVLFVFSFLPPAWFGWVRVLGCVLNRGQEWFLGKIFNDILANFLPPPWLGEWVGRCVARHGQWVIARTDANHPPPTNGQRQNCPKLTEDRLCIFCFGWHRNWPKVKADFVVATPKWCFARLYSSFASTFHIRPLGILSSSFSSSPTTSIDSICWPLNPGQLPATESWWRPQLNSITQCFRTKT